MKVRRVDVAVIGAGTAGLGARREAAKRGASTLLIESGPYGTTCARVGCMPSKLLIAAADAAHEVAGAGRFGVRVPEGVRVDGRAVLERVRRERDRFVGFVVEATEALAPEERLRGHARFIAPTTLEVDGETRVEARAVVIATGSAPVVPPELEGVRDRVLVNDDVFELEDLPESVAVLGAGIIGLELGQALHRLGVRVTLFSRSLNIGPMTDPEVRARAHEVIGAELDLRPESETRFEAENGGVRVRYRTRSGESGEETYERVLAATGRRPRVAELDLEKAGLELDAGGVPRFDPCTLQCGESPVFLAGDVTRERPLLHEAADEGRIAGANAAAFPDVRAHRRRAPLNIVFCDPELAVAGSSLRELEAGDIAIGQVDYADQGRARVMGRNAGLVRIYGATRCGTLLGAELFGPRVEHTAHLLAWAVQQRLSVERALEMPFYHPVLEEGIRTALRDLAAHLRVAQAERPQDMECGPGV